ncbi:class I mannose-6-phosphate isomerase [Microbacterium sp. RG1]|uniref:class I mannose-6-phosphate isomerase n=1 Tax=Microbacterium sp. RG1 TaxID=2489212 RepID=UPI001EE203AD|nr:class I mannose-6-phosphate isomerase [Microbacterium sp. RG1]
MSMIVRLPSNRPARRFYRGGRQITDFRHEAPAASHEPEDWVASCTTVFGEREVGLSRLPGGALLREEIAADPVRWLGEAHVARWGADPQLLVKLLDAGQRLPVHAHPDDAFAAEQLGHAHGKAEGWYILRGGWVHVGLRRPVAASELRDLVENQDTVALLDLLHTVPVQSGDVVWIPPGELHAIGEGVLLLELQQPEDLSILLEWRGFELDGARDGHLGLGFARALDAVNLNRRAPAELTRLVQHAPFAARPESVFPSEADPFLRLERHRVTDAVRLAAGFAVLVVTRGALEIAGGSAPAGSVFLVPAAEGQVVVRGDGEVLVARPPAP